MSFSIHDAVPIGSKSRPVADPFAGVIKIKRPAAESDRGKTVPVSDTSGSTIFPRSFDRIGGVTDDKALIIFTFGDIDLVGIFDIDFGGSWTGMSVGGIENDF